MSTVNGRQGGSRGEKVQLQPGTQTKVPETGKTQTTTTEMDEEDDYEECEEDEEMEVEPNTHPQTPARKITDLELDELLILLEADPRDSLIRAAVIVKIKNLYLNNGGIPINSDDPIPRNLNELSSLELVHVAQNMKLYLSRSSKDELVTKSMQIVANATRIINKLTGHHDVHTLAESLNNDTTLKKAFVEVFVGQGVRIHPLASLLIAGLSHASNLAVNAVCDKNDGPRINTGDQTTQGPNAPGTGPNATNANSSRV